MENENNTVSTVNTDIPGAEEKDKYVKIRTTEDLADWLEGHKENPISLLTPNGPKEFSETLAATVSEEIFGKMLNLDEEIFKLIKDNDCMVTIPFSDYLVLMHKIGSIPDQMEEITHHIGMTIGRCFGLLDFS